VEAVQVLELLSLIVAVTSDDPVTTPTTTRVLAGMDDPTTMLHVVLSVAEADPT
jgi:hypothetical protein